MDRFDDQYVFPVRLNLPESYSLQIGRVITHAAYLEWRLRETVYLLLRIGPKQGRLVVGTPRASSILGRIVDLMGLEKLTTSVDMKQLAKDLQECETFRDQLAHGIWLRHPKSRAPVLQKLSGNYQAASGKKTKARIDPEAVLFPPIEQRKLVRKIDILAKQVNIMRIDILRQRAASQKKSNEPAA